jgi:hypothetical protein
MWSLFLAFLKYGIGGDAALYTFSGLGMAFGVVSLVFCFVILVFAILSFFETQLPL